MSASSEPVVPAATAGGSSGKKSGTAKVEIPLLPEPQTHPIMPFKYDWGQHAGVCQFLKMFIVGLILFLPRLIIFLFAFFFLWLTSAMMLCCTDYKALNAFPLHRPIARFFLRVWSRVILFCMGYWWISVKRLPGSSGTKGAKAAGKTAAIIAPNHVSFVDAFYFAYAESPMAVAKGELAKVPIVGTITRATQTVFVQRQSHKGKNVADIINNRTRWTKEQPEDVIKKHGVWPKLLIFPEATCTNAKSIIQFKAGAFYPMMPVQPVCLDYHQNHLDVSWVGGMSPPLTLVRMMCQVYNKLHVTYLPIECPIEAAAAPSAGAGGSPGKSPGGYGATSPTTPGGSKSPSPDGGSPTTVDDTPYTFAERVRTKIARQLNVPLTNHNFLDVLLLRECRVLNLPMTAANVEMGAYPNGLDEAKRQLREFKKLDKNGTGTLDRKEFAAFLGFEQPTGGGNSPIDNEERHVGDSMVQALLSKWDVDGDGKINFREFLFFGAMLKARHLARTANMKRQNSTGTLGGGEEGLVVDANSGQLGNQDSREKQELLHAFALCFGAFDTDHDGSVRRGEFIEQVGNINHDVSSNEVGALFDRVDTDKDGIVSLDEYLAFCELQPALVMTFLDALATSDADLLSEEERSQTHSGEMTRENSFMSPGGSAGRFE